ncbi:MAG: hypothetical protein PUE91_04370 [Clostridiales bacterium]|nr:hypothetical protein [Clostridiales bacterium]
MSKTEKFFRAMAWLCLGVIIGFFAAPIKKGIDIRICSNNTDTVFGNGDEDGEDEADEPEELILE